jgi:hypothetical protein
MKKVYLVSHVQCWNDQAMEKNFQLFNTKEDAVAYKNELKAAIIADLIEYYEARDEDDLFNNWCEEKYDYECCWGYLNSDYTHEVEVEVDELDILSWKEM